MNNRTAGIGIAIVVLTYLILSTCTVVVHEYDQVVLTEFGQPVGEARTEPGLYFVMPWYERHTFSKRLLRWDGERAQIPTKDKRFIHVDTTARWRVKDALKFLQSVRSYSGAQTRLDDIIDSEVRRAISENDLIEAVRTDAQLVGLPGEATATQQQFLITMGRKVLQDQIVKRAAVQAERDFGIELLDVRVKRINYIDEVQASIYNRMIAERKKVAEEYRSQGKGRAAEILGRMEKQLKVIRSGAYRKAREVEGEADAEATRIYAEAYQQDPEFYGFMQTLETYAAGLGQGRQKGTSTSLVLSTRSDFFRYLKSSGLPAGIKPSTGPVVLPRFANPLDKLGEEIMPTPAPDAEAPAAAPAPAPTPAAPPAAPAPAP